MKNYAVYMAEQRWGCAHVTVPDDADEATIVAAAKAAYEKGEIQWESDGVSVNDYEQEGVARAEDFERLRRFIGQKLEVFWDPDMDFAVRAANGEILVSSGFDPDSPFYCDWRKLKPHIGHNVVVACYGCDNDYNPENIAIECEDCNEVLFDIDCEEGNPPVVEKQVIRYRVTFAHLPECNGIWELELCKSGAFGYGNGTYVLVTVNGKSFNYIDTRYERGIVEDFAGWCEKYMRAKFRQDRRLRYEKIAN